MAKTLRGYSPMQMGPSVPKSTPVMDDYRPPTITDPNQSGFQWTQDTPTYATPTPPSTQATSMYQTSSPFTSTIPTTSAGMYGTSALPSGLFGGLPSGGSLSVGDMNYQQGNVVPLEQSKVAADASKFGNLTDLAGTGLQTQAQKDVARTQIEPAMAKLDFTKSSVFPFAQQIINQLLGGGVGGTGGGSFNSVLLSSALNAMNPANEQAAINAAEAGTLAAAERGRLQGLQNVVGSGWSPSSPIGAAMTAATSANQARNAEEAKRLIRDQYADKRISTLAQAINANNSSMAPIYSLISSLLGAI